VIVGHPVTDPLYTGCKPVHGIDVVSGWCAGVRQRAGIIPKSCSLMPTDMRGRRPKVR